MNDENEIEEVKDEQSQAQSSYDIDLAKEDTDESITIRHGDFCRFEKVLRVNCIKNVTDRNNFA